MTHHQQSTTDSSNPNAIYIPAYLTEHFYSHSELDVAPDWCFSARKTHHWKLQPIKCLHCKFHLSLSSRPTTTNVMYGGSGRLAKSIKCAAPVMATTMLDGCGGRILINVVPSGRTHSSSSGIFFDAISRPALANIYLSLVPANEHATEYQACWMCVLSIPEIPQPSTSIHGYF